MCVAGASAAGWEVPKGRKAYGKRLLRRLALRLPLGGPCVSMEAKASVQSRGAMQAPSCLLAPSFRLG